MIRNWSVYTTESVNWSLSTTLYRLLSEARAALEAGEWQWALELSSHVYHVDREAALNVRLEALRALAAQQSNPLSRNFYLTTALDDHRLIDWTTDFSQVSRS